jgi:hypothetical protein
MLSLWLSFEQWSDQIIFTAYIVVKTTTSAGGKPWQGYQQSGRCSDSN